MHIDNRLLALLTAATLGTALIGCQREGADERASRESAQAPLAAAPSNREAPAGTESPAGAMGEKEKSGQPADQTGQKMNEPGNTTQDKPQQ